MQRMEFSLHQAQPMWSAEILVPLALLFFLLALIWIAPGGSSKCMHHDAHYDALPTVDKDDIDNVEET